MAGEVIFKICSNGEEKTLAFVERSQNHYLQKYLADVRKDIIGEVGELLPIRFRFRMKGMPVSRKQEERITLQKCSVEQQEDNDVIIKILIEESPEEKSPAVDNVLSSFTAPSTSKTALASSTNPFTKTVETTKHDLDTLLEEAEIANAKLQSLQQSPPHRPWYGKANFTCKNCHFKGHKVTKPCTLPPCRGFNECGILSMHQAHKVQISQAKSEVKSLERKVKNKQDELESLSLMQGRTRANFFSTMRPRLLNCDPIKYSSRETLENDLRVLASACNHKLPDDNIDLEDIISKKKNECHQLKRSSSSVEVHEVATSPKHRAVDQRRSQDSKRLRNITKRRQQSPPRRYNDKKRDKGYEWRKNLQPSPLTLPQRQQPLPTLTTIEWGSIQVRWLQARQAILVIVIRVMKVLLFCHLHQAHPAGLLGDVYRTQNVASICWTKMYSAQMTHILMEQEKPQMLLSI